MLNSEFSGMRQSALQIKFKNVKRSLIPLLLIFFTNDLLVQGQTEPGQKTNDTLSLQECINHALAHNITVKKAQLDLLEAEVNFKQSRLKRLPDVSGTVSESISNGNNVDPITSVFVSQRITSSSFYLNSSLTLFNGNQISNQVKQNQLLVKQNKYLIEESKNNISIQILESYLQALYAQEGIRVAENNLLSSEKELEQSRGLYEGKAITLKDLLDAQSQVATNQYDLIDVRKAYELELLDLEQLLELGPQESIAIREIQTSSVDEIIIPDKQEVYELALQWMPELQSEKTNINVLDKSLSMSRADFFPTLSLSGSIGTGYTSTRNLEFGEQLNGNLNNKISLSLSIPIFDRRKAYANTQNAKIEIEKARHDLTAAAKTIYQKIETAWLNATVSKQQMSATVVARDAARSAYELAQSKYSLGGLTATDLIVAQNTYTTAELNYVQAKYMTILYFQLLQFYKGSGFKF